MICYPNCKINLGLTVTRKRTDGFHELETVFYPVYLRDILEVITADVHAKPGNAPVMPSVQFSGSGLPVAGTTDNNLCMRAYRLLKKDFPGLPPVLMHLHKNIPMGAGLGGGSADGAFTIRLLNDTYGLGLTTARMIDYAAQLGSDCPFFIINKPCYATGRGERMEMIPVSLSGHTLVLISSGIHIDTGWAFGQLGRDEHYHGHAGPQKLKELVQEPVAAWKGRLVNDFEGPVFASYPEIRRIRDELYTQGALYAAMSGSGSTVFGIFGKSASFALRFPGVYRVDRVVLD